MVRAAPLKNPLVSIVMTMYNEAHVVEQAVETLLAQSYRNIELILVDDCSKDNTLKVVGKYAKRKNVRIIALRKNQGPGSGRNAGAKAARGKILVFIDADMVFDKDYVKGLIRPILEGKTIGTFHGTELVKNTDNLWARSLSINRMEGGGPTSGVFRAVLRKPFLEAGGFDASRGYFDDNLGSKLGQSLRADATCYHNNPETLGELYRHSRWVGGSLLRDKDIRARYRSMLLLSWLGIAAAAALAVLGHWRILRWLAAAGLALLAAFLLVKAVPRMIRERRPEYLFSIPVVWLVRLAGYYVGAAKQMFRK